MLRILQQKYNTRTYKVTSKMDLVEFGKSVSNQTRVRLLHLLSERDYSATEVYEIYDTQYNEKKHRTTIYRQLERMNDWGILDKYYDESEGELKYSLKCDNVRVDLSNSEIETE